MYDSENPQPFTPSFHWQLAAPHDHAAMAALCHALYTEDPSEATYRTAPRMHETLAALAANPTRGRAVVLKNGATIGGYALLIAFWSNEYGGEVCWLDELYIAPQHRSKGYGSLLLETLRTPQNALWPSHTATIMLEVHTKNSRARALYERLGFMANPNQLMLKFAEPA